MHFPPTCADTMPKSYCAHKNRNGRCAISVRSGTKLAWANCAKTCGTCKAMCSEAAKEKRACEELDICTWKRTKQKCTWKRAKKD